MFVSIVLLTNLAYVAAFDTETRCPAWVAYDLEPCEVVRSGRAAIPFRSDPRIPESDVSADYSGSGYDRGHMAPAADFNFDRAALEETYLYSNVCPMDPSVNRGAWASIENEVRRLATEHGTVHVVAWPEYDASETNRMGRVRVPAAFHKTAYGGFGARHWRVVNDFRRVPGTRRGGVSFTRLSDTGKAPRREDFSTNNHQPTTKGKRK